MKKFEIFPHCLFICSFIHAITAKKSERIFLGFLFLFSVVKNNLMMLSIVNQGYLKKNRFFNNVIYIENNSTGS